MTAEILSSAGKAEEYAYLSPEKIMQLGLAFWGSKTLLTAVELGVFTELAKAPCDAATLIKRLGLNGRCAEDFFDALVSLGLLERDQGMYRNARECEVFLDANKPSYIGGFLEMTNHRLYESWGHLAEALKTGKPQNESKNTSDTFAAVYADEHRLKLFLSAMTGISMGLARLMAHKFDWQPYKTFVDVGTAQGALAVEVAKAHGHLTGTGYDLAQVEPIFNEYAERSGLKDRLKFQKGDFFKEELPSADVIVMGHILHDWDLEQKEMLLAKAYKALNPGGAIIVYDAMIDDDRKKNAFGLLMSLNMLIETHGGFDYTRGQLENWMQKAGFKQIRFVELTPTHSMGIAIK